MMGPCLNFVCRVNLMPASCLFQTNSPGEGGQGWSAAMKIHEKRSHVPDAREPLCKRRFRDARRGFPAVQPRLPNLQTGPQRPSHMQSVPCGPVGTVSMSDSRRHAPSAVRRASSCAGARLPDWLVIPQARLRHAEGACDFLAVRRSLRASGGRP
jgi:hypothetical protein